VIVPRQLSRGLAIAAAAGVAVGSSVNVSAAQPVTSGGGTVTLSGRIGRCSEEQAVSDPLPCAAIARSPKLFIAGPFKHHPLSTSQFRVVSGDKERRFSVTLTKGQYSVKIYVAGTRTLYWATGFGAKSEYSVWMTRSRTGKLVRPLDLFPNAGSTVSN
jgi:hypothetical protein